MRVLRLVMMLFLPMFLFSIGYCPTAVQHKVLLLRGALFLIHSGAFVTDMVFRQ